MDKKNINEEFDLIDISGNDFVEELTIEEPNVKTNISNAEVKTEGTLSGKLDDNLKTDSSKISDSVSPSTTSGEPVSSNENVNNNSTNNGYSPESIPKENVQSENNNANNSRNSNIPNNTNNNFGHNRNSLNKQNNLPENNDSNNNLNNTPNIPQDNRSLKDKAKDAKDKINDTKDKIKNAPENIKNKIDDTKNKINNAKDKVNNAKDKIKNAPDNLKQKRDQVKDKWNNRPKNMKEAGNRAKDSFKSAGKGLKNKAKSGLKKGATKAKEKAKEGAKEAFNNTSVGQAVNKVKEVRDLIATSAKMMKKIISFLVKTFPVLEIAIGLILMVIVIATFAAYFMPGLFGDVNDSSKYEEYSKVDQKTLEEIRSIFASYPNVDATLAMATVLYPYYSNLHDGNVTVYLKGISDSDNNEDTTVEIGDLTEGYTGANIENEDENEEIDFYLLPFRNSKIRGRLKKLLSNMGDSGDNATFESYVKDEYFKKDKGFTLYYDKEILTGYNGYKNMFKSLNDSANEDALEDAIIKELYDIKDMFVNYVFENVNCSTTLIDAGSVDVEEMLKSTILIDPKVDSCTSSSASGIDACESWHSNPITLAEYVKGVVWIEMRPTVKTNIEKVKAQMVAAKSYVLNRYKTMGWDLKQTETGEYVIPIRSNTNDQDYCDYTVGCTGKRSGNNPPAANEEEKQMLQQAWDAISDLYIYNSETKSTAGSYCASRVKTDNYDCSWCTKGNCLSQTELNSLEDNSTLTVETILKDQYNNYDFLEIKNDSAVLKTLGALVCVNEGSNMSSKRNQIISNAITYVGKIPYYEGGLASSKEFIENDFGSDVSDDGYGRVKKGLNSVGFVNFIYWNAVDNNFGNENDINNILNDSVTYVINKEDLLIGDLGYSDDKTLIGIYLGNETWAYEDSVSGNVVNVPTDIFTNYRRLNELKREMYDFTIREYAPTPSEWKDMDGYYDTGNTGECVWYAKNRAVEIINELYANGSLTKTQYNNYKKRISNSRGNGNQFYLNGTIGQYIKSGSNNIDDYKSGIFMGMNSKSQYGHVAVIEYINEEENKIIITHGWNSGGTCNKTNYSCFAFRNQTYTYDEFVKTFVDGDRYNFLGYLYFLED